MDYLTHPHPDPLPEGEGIEADRPRGGRMEEVKKEGEEEVQGQPKTDAEKEQDAAWEEAGKLLAKPEEKGLPHPHPAPLPEGEGGKEVKAPVRQEDVSKEHGTLESVEKALKDTKAYATRLSQEKTELERKLKGMESGGATAREVEAAKKAVQQAQDNLDEARERIYRDYPEMKDVLDPLIETTRSLKKEVDSFKSARAEETEREKKVKALEDFNANVKPEIVKIHPDFDSIVRDEDYWKWSEQQRPALQFAAMRSGDPGDISWALTEFKKFRASDEAKEVKGRDEEGRKKRLLNSQTLRGGGSPVPFTGKGAAEDPDSLWEDAGKTLKAQGVAK